MTNTTPPAAHSAIRVLAALADLGEATAAAIADTAGLGYSTTTPKLRAWENTGHAERLRTDDGRTLWRLTAAGRAATSTTDSRTGAVDAGPPGSAGDPPDTTAATDDAAEHHTAADRDSAEEPDEVAEHDRATAGEPAAANTASATHKPGPASTPANAGSGAAGADAGPSPGTPAADPARPDTDAAATPSDSEGAAGLPAAADQAATGDDQPKPDGEATTAPARRASGSMRAAIVTICQSQPERQFKVAELCKLIDAAHAGANKASQGAVYNACTKLAAAGTLTQTVDKSATFQLTAT